MHIMVIPSWYANSRNKVHGSFFKEQFKALSKYGEKVTVAYNEVWPITQLGKMNEKRGMYFELDEGLRTYRYRDYNFLPKNPLMFKVFNKRMDKLYKEIVRNEGKVDVIHAHSSFWAGIAGAYLSRKYDIPLVITEHSSLKYAKYCKESYKKYIFDSYKCADSLIAVGSGLKSELQSYVDRDVKIISNMVDLSRFTIDENKKADNEKFNLFSCAFLEKGKRMELLITAFKEAFKNDKNVTLRIGGDGSQFGELSQLIEKYNLHNNVKLLGMLSRDEVKNEMQACDAFVLASEHETFGVVYIEALACGKPVIGTFNGGAEDIIKSYNGIICDKNDLAGLEKAMISMKNNYKTYDKYNIREKTILSYSDKILVEKLKGVYKEVYERKN